MDREAIERELASAGWEVNGSFSEHLSIGNDGDLCINYPVGDMAK